MTVLRFILWLCAAIVATSALWWSTIASRMPESMTVRSGRGEWLPRWDLGSVFGFESEPAHVVSRTLHTAMVQIPGISVAWTPVVNAVVAAILALVLARLIRRIAGVTLGLTIPSCGAAVVLLGVALLATNPGFGANWLHGERVGRVLVPLVFVLALLCLTPAAKVSAWRAIGAMLLAVTACCCDAQGVVVFLALAPILLTAAGSTRRVAWLAGLLICGNVAAAATFYPASGFGVAEHGLFTGLGAAFGGSLVELLSTTGGLWPDLLPGRGSDELLLGLVSWLTPLLLLAPRRSNAPEGAWWSLCAFGLILVLAHHQRYGFLAAGDLAFSLQERAELLYGGFLLPLGVIGLLAGRLGNATLPLLGGALLALAAQDYERGLAELRAARGDVERVEAIAALPEALAGPRGERELPTRDLAELLLLEERGLVPAASKNWISSIQSGVNAPADSTDGELLGGTANAVQGQARATLFDAQVACVVVGSRSGEAPFRAIGYALLERSADSHARTWIVTPRGAIPEGSEIRAVGIDVRELRGLRLGATFRIEKGKITPTEGSE